MNKLLICAFNLQKHRPTVGTVDVDFVTDEPTKYSEADWQDLLAPWSHRIRTGGYQATKVPPTDMEVAPVRRGQILVAMFDDLNLQLAWQRACEQAGAHCIVPEFPTLNTLENDLIREVSFFDFEFSGKNEWDGAPTRYSATCLRQLSSIHCQDYYPHWVFEGLLKGEDKPRRPLKVLDIGCGPVSVLRWGQIRGDISITGLDPNLNMYAAVLARHGLDALPKIRCDREVNGFAEDMQELLPNEKFDVIFTQNALDHTQQPAKVIDNIGRMLAPNGIAAFQVATREGTRQKWDQLHKTDIYLEGGRLLYAHQDTPPRPLLSTESRLRLRHIQTNNQDWLACSVEKRQPAWSPRSMLSWSRL